MPNFDTFSRDPLGEVKSLQVFHLLPGLGFRVQKLEFKRLGETIVTIASIITAIGVIFGVIFAIYKWYLKQEKQDKDIKIIKEEQFFLTLGVLACLKVLQEQGCDGPVTIAIKQLENHIDKQAHK